MIHPTPGNTRPYLWPDVLMDFTRGRRKSQTISGCRKGATKAPLAPSTWIGISSPVLSFRRSRADAQSLHILVVASEGAPKDGDDADRILVAHGRSSFGIGYEPVTLQGNAAFFHIPIADEFVPADLGVGAHDDVGPIRGFASLAHFLAPAPL